MTERRWAVMRLTLGFAQMFAATCTLAILLQTGLNQYSMAAGTITCLLTITSVLLFGSRRNRDQPNE